MTPTIIFFIQLFLSFGTTKSTSTLVKSIVIQIKGDCKTLGNKIAQEHGYRYVRQVLFLIHFELKNNHNMFNIFRSLMVIVK